MIQRIRKKYCKNILLNVAGRLKILSTQDERRIVCFVISGKVLSAKMATELLRRNRNM